MIMEDGKQLIPKIPDFNAGEDQLTNASELATIFKSLEI